MADDFEARHAAELNFAAAGAPTAVKGTLGVIVSAFGEGLLSRERAIELVEAVKGRPDIWISAELCDRVIDGLKQVP